MPSKRLATSEIGYATEKAVLLDSFILQVCSAHIKLILESISLFGPKLNQISFNPASFVAFYSLIKSFK